MFQSPQPGARGREKMVIPSSLLVLVHSWSGICQSPMSRPWSSSWKGWVGEDVHRGRRGHMELGLTSKLKQAVSNKSLSPNIPFPVIYFTFTRLIGVWARARNTLYTRATITQTIWVIKKRQLVTYWKVKYRILIIFKAKVKMFGKHPETQSCMKDQKVKFFVTF